MESSDILGIIIILIVVISLINSISSLDNKTPWIPSVIYLSHFISVISLLYFGGIIAIPLLVEILS